MVVRFTDLEYASIIRRIAAQHDAGTKMSVGLMIGLAIRRDDHRIFEPIKLSVTLPGGAFNPAFLFIYKCVGYIKPGA